MSLVLDFLFPRRCYGCGHPGQYFCPKCTSNLTYRPVKPHHPQNFDGTLTLLNYRGAVKLALSDLKFKFISDLVPEFVTLLTAGIKTGYPHLLKYWQDTAFTLIPIPLHSSRCRWRGFNQSELICQELSSKLGLSYQPDILTRIKNTLPQTKIKNKSLRRQNTSSAFSLDPEIVPPSKIILFDDVATTGSTLSSALSSFPSNTEAWALTIAG